MRASRGRSIIFFKSFCEAVPSSGFKYKIYLFSYKAVILTHSRWRPARAVVGGAAGSGAAAASRQLRTAAQLASRTLRSWTRPSPRRRSRGCTRPSAIRDVWQSFPAMDFTIVCFPEMDFTIVCLAEMDFTIVCFPETDFTIVCCFHEMDFTIVWFPEMDFTIVCFPEIDFAKVCFPELDFTIVCFLRWISQ